MTGNTKVWRAPLAGLASVAMIATMGVAASTANAAPASVAPYNFTVTFDANKGGEVNSSDTDSISTQDYRGADTILSDGYLTDSEISANFPVTPKADNVFTGWYTEATGGEKFNPSTFVNADDTLYAHYADRGDKVTVKFIGDSGTDTTSEKTVVVSKADNKLASWELPTDAPGDSKVLTGWKTALGSTVDAGLPVSAEALTTNIKSVLAADEPGKDQTLVLEPVYADATSVSFDTTLDTSVSYKVDVEWGKSIDLPTAEQSYVEAAKVYGTEWTEQGADKAIADGKFTASQADNANYGIDGFWNVNATKVQKAFQVSYYTEINGLDRKFATKIVDEKASAPKDAPAARNSGYTFAYYTESVDPATGYRHSYSEDQFASPVVKDTDLAAQWATKDAKVTFDLNYGGKTIEQSYQKGQTFDQPTATRDGWKLVGWYYNPTSGAARPGNPFDPDKDSEFEYKQLADGSVKLVNKSNIELSAYDSKRVPANARLRINETGVLQYEDTKVPTGKVDGTTGKPVYTTQWVNIPSRVYAAWQRSNENQVNSSINNVPTKDDKGDWLDASEFFKDGSWTTYRAEIEDVQAELAKPGLTSAQYADLLARVQAAQAKLEVKTDQTVYRLYNKQTGDHYFTAKQKEYDYLKTVGVNGEGAKFTAVSVDTVAKAKDAGVKLEDAGVVTALYSVYNQNTGEHLLVKAEEAAGLKAAGWNWDNDEKPVFYAPNAGGSEAVRRVYNPNTNLAAHVYTAEAKEYTDLTSWGWKADNDGKPLFYLDAAK